ncbi:MAG TPA: TlpA disulfide reductase family protein [Anaerolineae bacterium]
MMILRLSLTLMATVLIAAACTPVSPFTLTDDPAATPTVGSIQFGPLQPGSPAPGFTLKTLDGGTRSLSDYTGRPVLINFWASWCEPCRVEMPDIVEAYRAHRAAGLEVLAINNTQLDAIDDVKAFVAEFEMPFPALLDENGEVASAYSLIGLPTSVFIDAGGIVRAVHIGPITAEDIEKYLADILPTR